AGRPAAMVRTAAASTAGRDFRTDRGAARAGAPVDRRNIANLLAAAVLAAVRRKIGSGERGVSGILQGFFSRCAQREGATEKRTGTMKSRTATSRPSTRAGEKRHVRAVTVAAERKGSRPLMGSAAVTAPCASIVRW